MLLFPRCVSQLVGRRQFAGARRRYAAFGHHKRAVAKLDELFQL